MRRQARPSALCYPSFSMGFVLVIVFTTLVIFITKSFGWLGYSLGSLDDDVLEDLMAFCLVYLLIIER
jgi:hypothetical protein